GPACLAFSHSGRVCARLAALSLLPRTGLVTHKLARMLLLGVLLALGFGLVRGNWEGTSPGSEQPALEHGRARPPQVVLFLGAMSHEQKLLFTTMLAAGGPPGVVLFDSVKTNSATKKFLADFQPDQVIPVGTFQAGIPELECRLNRQVAAALPWKRGPPALRWKHYFPNARRVVVCAAEPRGLS